MVAATANQNALHAQQNVNPGAARDKGGTAVPVTAAAGLMPSAPTATVPVAGGVEQVPLDPRDAQYWADKAQRDFTISQQRAKYQSEGEIDQRNYAEALRQLGMEQPKQEQSAKENYNKAGLFYSGKLGEALNTLAQSYASRRGTATTELADRERARAAARAALDAGYPIEDAAAYAAAVDRQVGRDTEAADTGSLVANPTFATPAPATSVRAPASTSMTRPKVVVKNGSVYHYYPDGRKVYVRPAS